VLGLQREEGGEGLMARIRTIKPEAFRSRTIKKLSYPARWTFCGLLVQVDDEGRAVDDVDLIRADIYPLEMDTVSVKDVEMHIKELSSPDVDMVCRYSADGIRYLHIVNFKKHQRINRASESHIPCCPIHGEGGSPRGKKAPPQPSITEPSRPPHGTLTEDAVSAQPSRAHAGSGREVEEEREEECAPLASVTTLPPPAPEPARPVPAAEPDALFECAPAARADETPPPLEPVLNSQTLVAEWIDFRTRKDPDNKPPKRTVGQVAKELKQLLDEVSYDVVRQGFMEWDAKGASPSSLASFINQVQSRRARDAAPVAIPAQRPSATTLRTQTGLALMQEFAAEEGVDLTNVIPITRGITA
jgi:hypothetical protein